MANSEQWQDACQVAKAFIEEIHQKDKVANRGNVTGKGSRLSKVFSRLFLSRKGL